MAKPITICYTAVFSVITQQMWRGTLRDDTKDSCAAEEADQSSRIALSDDSVFNNVSY